MQLVLAITAVITLGAIFLIAFPPMTEQDRSIRDALSWDDKQAKLDRIIKGGN
jgi:hypothetical protein